MLGESGNKSCGTAEDHSGKAWHAVLKAACLRKSAELPSLLILLENSRFFNPSPVSRVTLIDLSKFSKLP